MSKIQMISIAAQTFKVICTIALFAAKAIVYICIALYVVGELLLSELETAPVKAVEVPEIVAVELAPVPCTKSAAKTMPTAVKAIELPFNEGPKKFDAMKAIELRKVCQSAGIKWRNAHGPSKHLTRSQILAALMA